LLEGHGAKSRFTDEQRVTIPCEADKAPVAEVVKKDGIYQGARFIRA